MAAAIDEGDEAVAAVAVVAATVDGLSERNLWQLNQRIRLKRNNKGAGEDSSRSSEFEVERFVHNVVSGRPVAARTPKPRT